MPTYAVITPTIGTPQLRQCIESVRGQDCIHYIVVDGHEHYAQVNKILLEVGTGPNIKTIWLEQNIGKGFYGHRVYAAAPFLVNEDILCFLDEDNWVEPSYVDSFRTVLCNTKYQWAHTLRNIVDAQGEFICRDDCENLGQWPVMGHGDRYHIDTSCFAVPRMLALRVSSAWYGGWGADRQFFAALKSEAPRFGCTTQYTLNYRLGGETNLTSRQMFLRGNQITAESYKGTYPWQFHHEPLPSVNPPATLIYRTTPQTQSL